MLHTALGDVHSACVPSQIEESSCSYKSKSITSKTAASGSKLDSGDVSGNLLKGHDGVTCNHSEDNSNVSSVISLVIMCFEILTY